MDNLFCGNPSPPLFSGGDASRWFVQRRFALPGMPISIPGARRKVIGMSPES